MRPNIGNSSGGGHFMYVKIKFQNKALNNRTPPKKLSSIKFLQENQISNSGPFTPTRKKQDFIKESR